MESPRSDSRFGFVSRFEEESTSGDPSSVVLSYFSRLLNNPHSSRLRILSISSFLVFMPLFSVESLTSGLD